MVSNGIRNNLGMIKKLCIIDSKLQGYAGYLVDPKARIISLRNPVWEIRRVSPLIRAHRNSLMVSGYMVNFFGQSMGIYWDMGVV